MREILEHIQKALDECRLGVQGLISLEREPTRDELAEMACALLEISNCATTLLNEFDEKKH